MLNEKWNVVWVEDESWIPNDPDILVKDVLPHGFRKVTVRETSDAYLNSWVDMAGKGFYPFSAEVRHAGYTCWANSRRFAICARCPQQRALIAELMHAYNVLGNRTEIYQYADEEIALSEVHRVGTALYEDDRECFSFRDTQTCREAIAGNFGVVDSQSSRIFLLPGLVGFVPSHW